MMSAKRNVCSAGLCGREILGSSKGIATCLQEAESDLLQQAAQACTSAEGDLIIDVIAKVGAWSADVKVCVAPGLCEALLDAASGSRIVSYFVNALPCAHEPAKSSSGTPSGCMHPEQPPCRSRTTALPTDA